MIVNFPISTFKNCHKCNTFSLLIDSPSIWTSCTDSAYFLVFTLIITSDTSSIVISIIVAWTCDAFVIIPIGTEKVSLINDLNPSSWFNLHLNNWLSSVIKEILWVQSLWPVIMRSITIISLFSQESDLVPWN